MRYLTVVNVLDLYTNVMIESGGFRGVRDFNALDSAVAQPLLKFNDVELYPGLIQKAAVLGGRIIQNHPFVDGNKRIGQLAMETFLKLNGYEISAEIDEQEKIILNVASGTLDIEGITDWLEKHVEKL